MPNHTCPPCVHEDKIQLLYEKVIEGNGDDSLMVRTDRLEASMAQVLKLQEKHSEAVSDFEQYCATQGALEQERLVTTERQHKQNKWRLDLLMGLMTALMAISAFLALRH
jgi:hypothetical protein